MEPELAKPRPAGRVRALVGLAAATRQRAGLRLLRELEERYGPIETWWDDRRRRLAADAGTDVGKALLQEGLDSRVDAALRALDAAGFRAVEPSDWPRLLTLPDPPLVLFQRGDPKSWERGLAIVGARRATGYGLRVTESMARGVASRGVAVLSGLARGIDAQAHRAALAAGGSTLAVLGCGADRVYPPEHAALQDQIGREGVVITEYLPGTPPLPPHFPRRNRILVALADAVLVIEARRKSGTLTSVGWAADLGREVLVVPGPIDSQLSEGPIDLLREGATAVGSTAHVLEALGLAPDAGEAPARVAAGPLSAPEGRIVALVAGVPLDLDELVQASGEAPSRVMAIVLSLEARGVLLREADGRSFRKA